MVSLRFPFLFINLHHHAPTKHAFIENSQALSALSTPTLKLPAPMHVFKVINTSSKENSQWAV
jgi:hypothetical protein